MGSCKSPMNFSVPPFNGPDGACRKAKWARQCNLNWDGITNNAELISQQKIQPDRTIGQLFGSMFTLETSGYRSTTRQTQDPNYLNIWED